VDEEELVAWDWSCSGTMAAATNRPVVLSLQTLEGLLSLVDMDTGELSTTAIGLEPTRLACLDDTMWVTLRGQGQVVRLVWQAQSTEFAELLLSTEFAEVGSEPYGIAVSQDGTSLYVALSREDAVVRLDARSLVEQERFAVGDEPRWIALDDAGKRLFVASAYQGRLSQVDLRTGLVHEIELPDIAGVEDVEA
jgi:DNA-binding beta-propeller fold protein YncE